ncbi:hypothetical protein BH09ACT13_BH09ACT13_10710 [soil metagenome]
MEDLIPIGQFAAASRLLLKALRLYDENGLLPPAEVDPTRTIAHIDSVSSGPRP